MSKRLRAAVIDLLWKHWTTVGVAGVGGTAVQAIDIEAMIALTPFVAAADPRLAIESLDWCTRFGKQFVSVSRLRQIRKSMPSPRVPDTLDVARMLVDKREVSERRLSKKSRHPALALAPLLQLRSRAVFGVGARADVISHLLGLRRAAGARRLREFAPTGYNRQTLITILDELAHAGVVERLAAKRSVRYQLVKESALEALLAPLPRRTPPWAERFAIVAHVLDAEARFGTRVTYAVELARTLHEIRPLVAAAGEKIPSTRRPRDLPARVGRWAAELLEDEVWESSWLWEGEDVSHEILQALNGRIVEVVQSGDYPAGHTEVENLEFHDVDRRAGTADFAAQFTAEHPKEDFSFAGYVEGTLAFEPEADEKEAFLESIDITDASAHFDVDAPDD